MNIGEEKTHVDVRPAEDDEALPATQEPAPVEADPVEENPEREKVPAEATDRPSLT